ncbi:transcription factor IIIB 50 kDa subunit-like [Mya arenaria]|uniref:transcription factor IIIB 50 kDa subunit-like n=1 Tax=Mya arenaria TaxID=6604 RepID=UPI0022E67D09|nr:transcription factor IIIB 50 kDa subunit-like [Mya arenaria]
MPRCCNCGSEDVIDDFENGRSINVCTECGTIVDDRQDFTSSGEFTGTSISDGTGHGPRTRPKWMRSDDTGPSKGLLKGKDLIDQVGRKLNLEEFIREDGKNLFEAVYEKCVKRTWEDSRTGMSLACLYVQIRKQERCISMSQICSKADGTSTLKHCGRAFKLLKTAFDIQLPPVPIIHQVDGYLQSLGFGKDVIKLALELVEILKTATVAQSRSVHHVAEVAAYYAWKNINKEKSRKVFFREFCSNFKISYNTATGSLYSEVRETLSSLAAELPWIKMSKKKTTKNDIDTHIGDILKYKTFLLQQAKQSLVNKMKDKLSEVERNGKPDDPVQQCLKEEERERLVNTSNEPGAIFRAVPKTKKKYVLDHQKMQSYHKHDVNIETETDSTVVRSESNCGECDKMSSCNISRKRSKYLDMEDEDGNLFLGSDDDTDDYILSENDVKRRKMMYAKFDKL